MKESRENFVDLKAFTTTIGIEQMIEFSYTGIIKITFDTIISLLDAASYFQINEALTLINDYLIKQLVIREYKPKKEPVNVIFCGHEDAGTSTIRDQIMLDFHFLCFFLLIKINVFVKGF